MKIEMVDLKSQYQNLKSEIDSKIQEVIDDSAFINGNYVKTFTEELSNYLNGAHVIPCANGTDALQIALMALDLKKGDEVIVPAFTYAATAEVIGLLGYTPVMCDVDPYTFNISSQHIEHLITDKTKCIIVVHLFGQSSDMETLLALTKEKNIKVIEDNAQSIGAKYTFLDGTNAMTGTMGDIGTTSFFPSKNLGCYGDGGAIFCNDNMLADKLKMIANHGQSKKYHHQIIGCNSRLDGLQAAILSAKLPYLDKFVEARTHLAESYDDAFKEVPGIQIPHRAHNSTHVFHQYTLRVLNGRRDDLHEYLKLSGIPSGIYYPLPLYEQNAFSSIVKLGYDCPNSDQLCKEVISLPMHTEMSEEQSNYIIDKILSFIKLKHIINER